MSVVAYVHPKATDPDTGVHCQNPKCNAKLAGYLDGELRIKCRKCGLEQTVIMRRRQSSTVTAPA